MARKPKRKGPIATINRPRRDKAGNLISPNPAKMGFPTSPMPQPGSVTFTSRGRMAVTVTMDGPPVEATEADTGWEVREREKRKNAIRHKGSPLEAWTILVIISPSLDPGPVNTKRLILRRMASKLSPATDPPDVRVLGVPEIPRNKDFKITSLESAKPEEWLREQGTKTLKKAFYTVTVTEAELETITKIKPAKSTRNRKGVRGKQSVLVRVGDTGTRIAVHFLGDASRWRELKVKKGKKFVKLRDPDNLRPGQWVYLP